jgi:hypothetical protein
MTPDPDPREEQLWEAGWQGHSHAQRRRLARLPLAEKLLWLEEAHKLLLHLERERARRKAGDSE